MKILADDFGLYWSEDSLDLLVAVMKEGLNSPKIISRWPVENRKDIIYVIKQVERIISNDKKT